MTEQDKPDTAQKVADHLYETWQRKLRPRHPKKDDPDE